MEIWESQLPGTLRACSGIDLPALFKYKQSIKYEIVFKYSDIFPTRCNITQFIYFWKTILHVSGVIFTHRQEHTQPCLQYLVLVKPLLLPTAIVEELELV